MGCYFAIFVPRESDYDFSCAYSTFGMIRLELAAAALRKEKDTFIEDLESSIYIPDNYDKLVEKLEKYKYRGIATLLLHSDCDGTYSAEEAKDIVDDYRKVRGFIGDTELMSWIKSMIKTFERVSEEDGIILVC